MANAFLADDVRKVGVHLPAPCCACNGYIAEHLEIMDDDTEASWERDSWPRLAAGDSSGGSSRGRRSF
jgi:hypothetical protein